MSIPYNFEEKGRLLVSVTNNRHHHIGSAHSFVLLFDFDDTLSEQVPFNIQYVRGIGNVLSERFGGEPEAWAKSAIDMLVALEQQYISLFSNTPTGYNAWYATMHGQAMELVFSGMNLPLPIGIDAEQLSRDTQRLALGQCDALFPGVRETLSTLQTITGYTLHMASGNDSGHLRSALAGAGLGGIFDRLYGPDLIDCAKEGPLYYERIFADLNIAPRHAIVIDNEPFALQWALDLGAHAIQVDLLPHKTVQKVDGTLGHVQNFTHIFTCIQEAIQSSR